MPRVKPLGPNPQDRPNWNSLNEGQRRYAMEQWKLARVRRGEHFDNASGARGLVNVDGSGQKIGATVNTYTLTGNITLADGHLLLKPELRMDAFNKLSGTGNESSQQFMDANGAYTKNGQTTLGMAAIYKF